MKSMLKSLMSVAAAALALTSCSNDATEDVAPNGGLKTLEVNATIDQTRTVMAANHVNLNWTADDEILLYIGKTGSKNIIKPQGGGTITGVTYTEGDMVYANYSIDNDKYSDGATAAEINIVASQTQSEANVFAGTNLPMVANGEIKNGKVDLVFHPVGCVLVFNVYGPAGNEKVKSIKFTTTKENCRGYKKCDLTAGLTAEALGFTKDGLDKGGKYVEVTLTTPAAIGAGMPSDTKVGENQVYMVVAPFNYTAATFTVTTDAGSTYTFDTKSGIDCSTNTARVVNLNLAKATAGFSPEIIVPTVGEQPSDAVNNLTIEGITFKNIAPDQIEKAEVAVYEDDALTKSIADPWIKFSGSTSATLVNGTLNCALDANTSTEARTAYIGIKCADVQAAIAVKQVGSGSTPAVSSTATYTPEATPNNPVSLDNGAVTLTFDNGVGSSAPRYYAKGKALRCYAKNTITVASSTAKITKIVITSGMNDGNTAPYNQNNKLSVNGGIWSDDTLTWTGDSNEVVLTVLGTSGQIRIGSMDITYVESNEPKIIVPTTVDKQPAAGGDFTISGISFKNIDVNTVTTGVYSEAELASSLTGSWLTIKGSDLANGTLSCNVAANETTESRTAYIGIKFGERDCKAAIAVTQKAKGAVDKYFVKVTEAPTDWAGTYLIVNEYNDNEVYAFNGVKRNSGNSITVTKTEQGILYDVTDTDLAQAVVIISKKEGTTNGYMLQVSSNSNYFYSDTDSNNTIKFDTNDTTATPSTIEIVDGSAKITSSAGSILRYNANSVVFKYYKSTSYTSQQPIQLYKLQK